MPNAPPRCNKRHTALGYLRRKYTGVAYFSRLLYEADGRRSKKREATIIETLREEADALAADNGATIHWDHPLIEARRG